MRSDPGCLRSITSSRLEDQHQEWDHWTLQILIVSRHNLTTSLPSTQSENPMTTGCRQMILAGSGESRMVCVKFVDFFLIEKNLKKFTSNLRYCIILTSLYARKSFFWQQLSVDYLVRNKVIYWNIFRLRRGFPWSKFISNYLWRESNSEHRITSWNKVGTYLISNILNCVISISSEIFDWFIAVVSHQIISY